MATIVGTSGSDTITGTAGADVLTGGAGNDRIEGGDGDDVIVDENGANVILAGAGNDRITLTISGIANTGVTVPTNNRVEAGDGNDLLTFKSLWFGNLSADMGAGDDIVDFTRLAHYPDVVLTLGSGQDRVVFGHDFDSHFTRHNMPVVITDFAAGDSGDSLDLSHLLSRIVQQDGSTLTANPFAGGFLRLVQDGSDVIVVTDSNGNAADGSIFVRNEIVRLVNVTAEQLTTANFSGWNPLGTAPVARVFAGSAAADRLAADVVATTIDGLGGDDILIGGANADTLGGSDGNDDLAGRHGNDRLEGGIGNDLLDGGAGNDILLGGDGDDRIVDAADGATIHAGAGEDVIILSRSIPSLSFGGRNATLSVLAGDGRDIVEIGDTERTFVTNPVNTTATIDLGTGDDVIRTGLRQASLTLTLGTGSDRIELISPIGDVDPQRPYDDTIIVTDFAAGAGGDAINLDDYLERSDGWEAGTNAFDTGYFRLVQSGADVELRWDYDGEGGSGQTELIAVLRSVTVASLVAHNFDGHAPTSGIVARSFTPTTGNDWFVGSIAAEQINGGGGADWLRGGGGDDRIDGGAGNDRLDGEMGIDQLFGGLGDDVLEARFANGGVLNGGDGNDTIIARPTQYDPNRTTIIDAGAGDDLVDVAAGAAQIDLGEGNDRLLLTSATTVTLGAGIDTVQLNYALSSSFVPIITDFQTGDGGDRLDFAASVLREMVGSWTIAGGDVLNRVNPFVSGELRLVQVGDHVELRLGYPFRSDSIVNDNSTRLLVLQNTSVTAFTAHNLGFDPALVTHGGTSGAETIDGTAGRNVIQGNDGNDTVNGLDGDDVLRGGAGDDILNGGAGYDYLVGGSGTDQMVGGDGDDILLDGGAEEADLLDGGEGNDVISGYSANTISGGGGDDVIRLVLPFTGSLSGSLSAGDGNDTVTVNSFRSLGFGGSPHRIDLGAGDDLLTIDGYSGLVTLGAGRDRVEFTVGVNRGAIITDFQAGANGDVLDFASLTNESGIGDPTRALQFGYAQLVQSGSNTVIVLRSSLAPGTLPLGQVILQNVKLSDLTAENLDGYSPSLATMYPAGRFFQSSTTIAAGTTLNLTNTRPAGQAFNTPIIIEGANAPTTVSNAGTINTRLTDGVLGSLVGIYASRNNPFEMPSSFNNLATGIVTVTSTLEGRFPGGFANGTIGVLADRALNFRNEGRLTVVAESGPAFGVYAEVPLSAITIDNRGQLNVATKGDATGIYIRFDAAFFNTGTITVHGDRIATGVDGLADNAGIITVTTSENSLYASTGMYVEIGAGRQRNVVATNSGTITADVAVWFYDDFPGADPTGSNELYTNTGTLNGAVIVGRGHDVLINSGTINGRALLGLGNDRYDGGAGRINGSVEAGNGADVLIGGRFADALFGENGDDVISAGSGDDYVEGGNGNDMLDGGAGIDILSYAASISAITVDLREALAQSGAERDFVRNFEIFVGSRGADSLFGADVQDTLYGYFGDDVIEGRGGDDILIGGRGNDRLTGGAGLDRFLFDAGDGADIITDFTGNDAIEIFGYTGAQSMTQVGADVRITLSAGDSILVRGTTVSALTPANLLFTSTAGAIAIPDIPTDTLVGESYFGIGSSAQIELVNPFTPRGGFVAPIRAAILIDTLITGNVHTLGGGVWNAGSVSLNVTEGTDAAYGVRNFSRGAGFDNNYTHYIGSANSSLSVASSVGRAVGVDVYSFWNAGSVTVSSTRGDVWGVTGLFPSGGSPPFPISMVNLGTVSATASGFARGIAPDIGSSSGPTTYFNHGSITAQGGTGAIALQVDLFAHPLNEQPLLVNGGILRATDSVAGDSATALLIRLDAQGRVWNSGTIEGEFSIRVIDATTATTGFSQTIYNSGNILGRVVGGSYEERIVNTGLMRGNVALGSGADFFDGRQGRLEGALSGGDNADILLTGQGDQLLSGDLGDDTLSGGTGVDTLTGGVGRDSFRFESGFGADIITDFNTGSAHDYVDVAGYTAAQSMVQQGADVLISFSATDTLLLRNVALSALTPAMIRFGAAPIAASTIPSAPTAPAAPVQPAVSLDSTVTFLPVIGTDKADTIIGDVGPDDLRGLESNDRLDGRGGNDRLYGGTGDDIYLVDSAGDIVFEQAGQGIDRVEASAGYYLFAEVENLTLVAGSGGIFGVGNDLENLIVGNEGANLLIAGAGADVLRGGAGGDALFGQAGKDVLEGEAGVDYLVGGGDADTIRGGIDADALYGEDGDDTLDGGDSFDTDILVGGAGNDILEAISGQANPDYDLIEGGAGNDSFYVDTGADLTFEGVDGGVDTVYADVPVVGAGVYLYANVENLVLLGATAFGVGNELGNSLTGNASGNFLLGGAGADVLNGMGGGDVLFGEGGADIFVFGRGTGGDVIGDFERGVDRIDLRAFGFSSFAQLQSAFVQNGDIGAIVLGNGDLVVLHGVQIAQLADNDFLL